MSRKLSGPPPRRPASPDVDDHARRVVRVPIGELSNEIVATLEGVARRLGADRATLWEQRPAERRLVLVQQWAREGWAQTIETLAADDYPWLHEQVAAARPISFRACTALPPQAIRERKLIARHGPRSGVVTPIVVGDATAAVLMVGTMRRERSWGRATLAYLERAGVVLAGALVRQRAHEEWLGTEGRLAGVLEAGPIGILLARHGGRIELANGQAASLFHRTQRELVGARLQDMLVPTRDGAAMPGRSVVDVLLASDAPFGASWKTRAAAPAQPRPLDDIDDALCLGAGIWSRNCTRWR